MNQLVALFVSDQCPGGLVKINSVSHCIADAEIDDGADGKVDDNFYQGVDLVFLAYRADFQKSETAMHGEYHGGA